MRWTPGRRSQNIEDRRGQTGGGGFRGGPVSIGILLVLVALSLLTGRNFLSFIDPNSMGGERDASIMLANTEAPYAANPLGTEANAKATKELGKADIKDLGE